MINFFRPETLADALALKQEHSDETALILKVTIPCNLKSLKMHKVAHTAAAAPILTAAVCYHADNSWSLALSGISETPMRLRDAEALLSAEYESETLVKAVADTIFPIADFRASAEYRRKASAAVIARLVNETLIENRQETHTHVRGKV